MQIWFNWGADINVGQMEVMQRVTQGSKIRQININLDPALLSTVSSPFLTL